MCPRGWLLGRQPFCVVARQTTHTDATHADDRKSMNPSRAWKQPISAHLQNDLGTIAAALFDMYLWL